MGGKAQFVDERARAILKGLTYGHLAAHADIYGLPLRAIPKTSFSFMSYLHVRWAERAGWRPRLESNLLSYGSDGDKRQLVEEWVARSVQTITEAPSSPPTGDFHRSLGVGGSLGRIGSGALASAPNPWVQQPAGPVEPQVGRRAGRRRHYKKNVAGGASAVTGQTEKTSR
jgi:hypothetical protein